MVTYDVAIIGSGPAGLSAALYCKRANLKVIVFGDEHKTQFDKSTVIENYLGFETISGSKLSQTFYDHVKSLNVDFNENYVVSIEKEKTFEIIDETKKEFSAKTVIISSGMNYSKANIKNEDKFKGKGIVYCVLCDGPMFRKKKCIVVGNTNYAAQETLELLTHTKDVTLFLNGKEAKFSKEFDSALKKNKIKIRTERIMEVTGNNIANTAILDSGEKVSFDGMFIAVGNASAISFSNKLGLETEGNYLKVDKNGKTSVEGVYAAGGVTSANQIAISVGQGAAAGIETIKYLSGKTVYIDHD